MLCLSDSFLALASDRACRRVGNALVARQGSGWRAVSLRFGIWHHVFLRNIGVGFALWNGAGHCRRCHRVRRIEFFLLLFELGAALRYDSSVPSSKWSSQRSQAMAPSTRFQKPSKPMLPQRDAHPPFLSHHQHLWSRSSHSAADSICSSIQRSYSMFWKTVKSWVYSVYQGRFRSQRKIDWSRGSSYILSSDQHSSYNRASLTCAHIQGFQRCCRLWGFP